MDRKYTLAEVDEMRASVKALCSTLSSSYDEKAEIVKVEQRLRTYMQNGTEPSELKAAAAEHSKRQWASFERMRKMGLHPA